MNLFAILLLSWFAAPLQGPQLDALRASVLSLRQHSNDHPETRGATSELTVAKHRLRAWVETYLTRFRNTDDANALAEELRNRMTDADLFCVDYDNQCFPSSIGFLDEVRINRDDDFLIVRTAVGIWCGYDYSAYVYKWSSNQWRRVWENEQNSYAVGKYAPQIIHSVHISSPDKEGNRLLLTLGSKPGCSSAFMPVYYRVWQMNAAGEARKLLLDREEIANLDTEPPILGRATPDDVLLQFTAGGTGYGDSHIAVRHFDVRSGRAQQTDPIATTPRDFVEEWLSAQWSISKAHAESPALKQWHDKLHRDDGMGDFPDPAMRCTNDTDLWQVGTHLHESPKIYYRIRWRQPYNFTMMDISENPFPDCATPDPKGDEHPELFRADF